MFKKKPVPSKRTIAVLPLLAAACIILGSSHPLYPAPVIIPGKADHICYHVKYFYNFPNRDFLYYFNDQLLFLDKLPNNINKTKYRKKTLIVVYQHRRIREFIAKHDKDPSTPLSITLDLRQEKEQQLAIDLCQLLGLQLLVRKNNRYMVVPDNSADALHFYEYVLLKPRTVETQVNKTGKFHFQLTESKVSIPWDLKFLRKISGIHLTADNFFEHLLKDIRFSLLVGTLFRLSANEIDFIDAGGGQSGRNAWEPLLKSKKNILGLLILSMALRVQNNQILLPGGEEARSTWKSLAKADPRKEPMKFITNLTTKDKGKLNYFFTFTSFLPLPAQQQWLVNLKPAQVKQIYEAIRLHPREEITGEAIPQLQPFNFFTLLYAIQIKNNQMYIPAGPALWCRSLDRKQGKPISPIGSADSSRISSFDVIITLLKKNKRDNRLMEAFIALYSKFQDRPAILTRSTLPLLLDNYAQHNILIDAFEKLPFKDPESILRLLRWVNNSEKARSKKNELFYSIYQSLMELMAQAAMFGNNKIDCDRVIEKMTAPGVSRAHIYNRLIHILEEDFAIRSTNSDRHFFQFLLGRLYDIDIHYAKNYYLYPIRQNFQKTVSDICSSQEVSPLSVLMQLDALLSQVADPRQKEKGTLVAQIFQLVEKLPSPEISEMAPKWIREAFIPYKKETFWERVTDLRNKITQKCPPHEVNKCVTGIRANHLLYYLRDYLLASVYAINIKHNRLRALLNPNLIRLHDFTRFNHKTAWNNAEITRGTPRFSSYHLRGGLSRLNITFASSYIEHYLNRNTIYDPSHLEGIVYNFLDLFPVSGIREADKYVAWLCDFGLELIQKGLEDTELSRQILAEMATITAGFHYHSIHRYLKKKSQSHNLFLSEIFALGEAFFKTDRFLHRSSICEQLKGLKQPERQKIINQEMVRFGSLFYKTLGTLKTRRVPFFPMELSTLFRSGAVSGEMLRELKINVAYHAVKKKLSPSLLGQVMLTYFIKIFKNYYNQNYKQDYFASCFFFNIFNSSYLNRVILTLKRGGQLRIK